MNKLAILGASGHGKVIADVAESCGYSEIIFFDDSVPAGSLLGCWLVAGDSQALVDRQDCFSGVVVAIGDNRIRSEKLLWLNGLGVSVTALVHPSAIVSRYAQIGPGTVVMPGAVVNASTVVGNGVILNTGCSIDHDCHIGDYAHICPGARLAGGVNVGARSIIGVGAAVKQLVSIGKNVIVGAGAAVISNLPDEITAVGVPALPV